MSRPGPGRRRLGTGCAAARRSPSSPSARPAPARRRGRRAAGRGTTPAGPRRPGRARSAGTAACGRAPAGRGRPGSVPSGPGQRGSGRPGSAVTSAIRTLGPAGERVPGRQDHDLPLRAQLLGVEPGRRVERPVQQRHVGPPVAQQPLLLADAAQQHVDGDRAGFGGVRVEQLRQQFAGRSGLRDQDQAGLAGRGRAARRVRRSAASTASRAARPSRSSTDPASVSVTARLVRSSSATPSRRSSCRIARDSGGCAIPSRCAARPKCSSSATATKYRSSRVSMPPPYRRIDTRQVSPPTQIGLGRPPRARTGSMA